MTWEKRPRPLISPKKGRKKNTLIHTLLSLLSFLCLTKKLRDSEILVFRMLTLWSRIVFYLTIYNIHLSINLYYPSIYSSVLSLYQSIYFIHLSINLYYPSIYQFILSIYLAIYIIHLSNNLYYPSIYQSILSIYLLIYIIYLSNNLYYPSIY